MKTKSRQVQFLTLLVCLLMAVPAVLAPSHPVFIDEETGKTIDEILPDPGTTPDSLWYGFERWWEDIQVANADTSEEEAALLQSLILERYAEFHTMIEEGNYDVAEYTISEIAELEDELVETVKEIKATGENLNFIHDVEKAAFTQENIREMMEQNMDNLAAAGELSSEQAGSLATILKEEIINVQAAVEEQEEEITDAIAEEQGITHLEAEVEVEAQEEEAGLTEQHQEEVIEGLEQAVQELNQLQSDLAAAIGAGEEIPLSAIELIAEAQARLDSSQNAYFDGRYGESFGQFTAAEHLIDTAYDFLDSEVSPEELLDLVEESQERNLENSQEYLDEYEEHLARWIEEHPQYAYNFDEWAEQSKNELALYLVIGEEPFVQLQEQLRAEGKTEQEIFDAVTDRYRDEYERAFGTPYAPPVIEGVDDGSVIFHYDEKGNIINPRDSDTASTKGGFVEGYSYTDPVTGYLYEFTEDGYTYTTPLGVTYSEKFQEGFSVPAAYEKGNEQHSYTMETPEGTVTYNYYATGYDVTLPDGKTKTYSYPEGGYDVVGGGFFENTATGFDFRHEGKSNHYDYNPVYDTFVGSDGTTYRPPEGTYFHGDVFEYDYEDQNFQYEGEEREIWAYDPVTNVWTSPTGETNSPDRYTVAPIGHEGEGEYSTATGEIWSYDETMGTWSNAGGDSYNHETGAWESGSGRSYEFHHSTGQFLDPETGDVARDVVWSGVTWYFDGETNSWTSNTGQTYEGVGGIATPPGGGGYREEYEDNDWSYDASAGIWTSPGWTFDASTGEWSSPEGESFYDPDGNPTGWYAEDGSFQSWDNAGWAGGVVDTSYEGGSYSGGGGYDASGNYVGGEYGSYDASGTYTGRAQYGGTYAGEGYTGGYEGGSYSGGGYTGGHDSGGYSDGGSGGYGAPSGGESGGSAPSGGDGGGGGHSDGGGGGDGGGGTSMAVAEPGVARELHPVTRFIYKYLGIRN